MDLVNSSVTNNYLDPIFEDPTSKDQNTNPVVGVSGHVRFNSSARLSDPILGSVRTMRDYVEGGNILVPEIQDAIDIEQQGQAVFLKRLWLDNTTTTTLSFYPTKNASANIVDGLAEFTAGEFTFNASFNYPQLTQLSPEEVLHPSAHHLITDNPDQANSLSFLSYTDKLTAGAWRFLTYFGRDSAISMLLMAPILSSGVGSALEAGIAAALERINRTDGSVAHEETVGDYATYLNKQEGSPSTNPVYDYKMVDTDFFLPIILAEYLIENPIGRARAGEFLATKVSSVDPDNSGLTFGELAALNAGKIMNMTAAFAAPGGQKKENLIKLKEGEPVGQWRDSNDGLGGGRYPYDVNTAIAPAGLRAIAALSREGHFPSHPEWADQAAENSQVWEEETLHFFHVEVDTVEAKRLVEGYTSDNGFPFPSRAENITSAVSFYGLALDGYGDHQPVVRVMNTDDCFRHFLLNTTNQAQLTAFVSQTADNILRPFPAGLMTDAGLVVANPALSDDPSNVDLFSRSAYHGTVVWSWQLAMMARGLERQLARCETSLSSEQQGPPPDFCSAEHGGVKTKVTAAYNRLWDVIEDNTNILSGEVWSWRWDGSRFIPVALGELNPTESNVRQLWSLTFLAVTRNEGFR